MLEFKIPSVGENITKGTVVKINVTVGASVKKDQELLELETDKASIPVPSPIHGVIKEILIKEGQDVKIGQVVMNIEESSGSAPASKPASKEPAPAAKETKTTSKPADVGNGLKPFPTQQSSRTFTPVANESIAAQVDVPAAPSVRRLARELGVNLSGVPGSGPKGRISEADVKSFVKGIITGGISAGASSAPRQQVLPDFAKWGDVERKAMSNIRKKTAEHLSYAWNTIPHVTQFDKADITNLDKLRKRYSTETRKLTITPFLMKVLASALKNFPQFNTSIDMTTHEVIYKKYFHIGVAVDTERGLLVPVVRNVDQKSIFEIADELQETAERARNKKLTLDDMQGASFTVTNLGGIGGTNFTPIVNWPEVAILGVSRGGIEPVIEQGQLAQRLKLPLSLSYDHRIIDGADGARFLRWVCEAIEQPFLMELEK